MGRTKKTNVVPASEFKVEIMRDMICLASNVFDDLERATESAKRIVKACNKMEPTETTYAMIWHGKTLKNWIEY